MDRSVGHNSIANTLDEDSDQYEQAVKVFTSFGDKLFDILCHDCTVGHDVCKMLAFSCVDMLLEIDSMASFIQFISKRGITNYMTFYKEFIKLLNIFCFRIFGSFD